MNGEKMTGMEKLSIGEKLAYAAGGMPSGIMYILITTFLTYFYTNVLGIPVASVGTIVLISRVFDGISDLIAGVIIDRTKSKHGKARSWMLRMVIPYAISGVLLFLVPKSDIMMVKLVFIFVTYNLALTVVYTMVDTSYNTLMGRITQVQSERTSISVFRMGIGTFVQILISAFTLPLISALGDDQKAWVIVTSVYFLFASIMMFVSFKNTRERVGDMTVTKEQPPVLESIKTLLHNPYWGIVLGVWLLAGVGQTILGVDEIYYCQYIFGDKELLGTLTTARLVPTVVVILTVLTPLVKRFGSRNVMFVGILLAVAAQGMQLLVPKSFVVAVIASVLKGIGSAPISGLIFAMLNDTVEYGHWKTGIRVEGLTNSAAGFGSKVGTGLASAAVTGVLGAAGFDGMLAVQSEAALAMISNLYLIAPLIIYIMVAALLYFYKLDKLYPQIMEDLKARNSCQ